MVSLSLSLLLGDMGKQYLPDGPHQGTGDAWLTPTDCVRTEGSAPLPACRELSWVPAYHGATEAPGCHLSALPSSTRGWRQMTGWEVSACHGTAAGYQSWLFSFCLTSWETH